MVGEFLFSHAGAEGGGGGAPEISNVLPPHPHEIQKKKKKTKTKTNKQTNNHSSQQEYMETKNK